MWYRCTCCIVCCRKSSWTTYGPSFATRSWRCSDGGGGISAILSWQGRCTTESSVPYRTIIGRSRWSERPPWEAQNGVAPTKMIFSAILERGTTESCCTGSCMLWKGMCTGATAETRRLCSSCATPPEGSRHEYACGSIPSLCTIWFVSSATPRDETTRCDESNLDCDWPRRPFFLFVAKKIERWVWYYFFL